MRLTWEDPAAIASTHRLSDQHYGLTRNDECMMERLEKELVHELGHAFGLYHCRQFECVMRASTYVEEIDLKRVYPCSTCTAALLQRNQLLTAGKCPAPVPATALHIHRG